MCSNHIYLKILHNGGSDGEFVDWGRGEVFDLKRALTLGLLHGLLGRCSAHLGAFVHEWRALGDDARQLRPRDKLFRLGYFEFEYLELVRARREQGR